MTPARKVAFGLLGVAAVVTLVLSLGLWAPEAPAPPPPPSSEAEKRIIPDLDAVRERIRLLPGHGPADGISWSDSPSEKGFEEDQAAAVKAASFPRWQRHEDEFLSFSYPVSPHISLQVQEAGETFTVMGGAVSDCENTFVRNYRLATGDVTYCAMMLDRKDRFDDGICMCGAIVYRKYLFRNGALYRFSFLEWHNGAIKKIQILKGGLRVVLFEWTHMPIHQETYLKIAFGIELKGEPLDEAASRRTVFERYGFEGRAGFLEKGMSRGEIVALLGEPAEAGRRSLTYRYVSDDRVETTLRVPLEGDIFCGFRTGWRTSRRLPPDRGSVDWINEKATGLWARVVPPDYDLGPVTAEDARFMFERFLALAPEAEAQDWGSLCCAISSLFDKGFKDARVVPVVRGRYLDVDLPQHWACWVLHKYDNEGSQDLFVKRAKLILDTLSRPDRADWDPGDLDNLLAYIDKNRPEREAIVLACMDHKNEMVRSSGYFRCGGLTAGKVLPRIIAGLSDEDSHIRFLSATAFRDDYGDARHVPLLKERLNQEDDEDTREALESAIKRLSR